MRRACAGALLAVTVAWGSSAVAAPGESAVVVDHGPAPRPADLVAAARRAEGAHDPAGAERLYAAALESAPNARETRLARRRLEWLRARSEGSYEPLQTLMRLRAAPHDRAGLDAAAAAIEAFPPGIVKREAWAVLGDGYAAQGALEPALAAYRRWLESPGLNDGEREIAHSKAALVRARIDGAIPSIEDLRRAGLDHRAEIVLLRARWLSKLGTPLCAALIGTFAALGLGATRGRGLTHFRTALSPARLGLGIWLLLAPIALVRLYDRQLVSQVVTVMAALAAALLLATVVGAGEPGPRWRRVLAPLGALSVVGAAFMALDRSRLLFDILWSLSQAPH